MDEAIGEALQQVEQENAATVLFAAESGSRAWGFASPDSDYDVRFIYVQQPEWYLRVFEARDVIEAMLPGDLDLSGWELRKTLRLFAKCNLALNEWLGSPIVYRDESGLAARLRELIPAFFRPPHAVFHYLRMAQSTWRDHLDQPNVRLKKVFYALRPLLACQWIEHTRTQPPTEFQRLVEAEWVDDALRTTIADLRAAKLKASEEERQPLSPSLARWLADRMEHFERIGPGLTVPNAAPMEILDSILRECVEAWLSKP